MRAKFESALRVHRRTIHSKISESIHTRDSSFNKVTPRSLGLPVPVPTSRFATSRPSLIAPTAEMCLVQIMLMGSRVCFSRLYFPRLTFLVYIFLNLILFRKPRRTSSLFTSLSTFIYTYVSPPHTLSHSIA